MQEHLTIYSDSRNLKFLNQCKHITTHDQHIETAILPYIIHLAEYMITQLSSLDNSQVRYRWIGEQKGRTQRVRTLRENKHNLPVAALRILPQVLILVTSLAPTTNQPLLQPGDSPFIHPLVATGSFSVSSLWLFSASLLMSACSSFCFLLYFFHLYLSLFNLQLSIASAPPWQLRNSWSLRRGRVSYVYFFRNSKRVQVQNVLAENSKLKQKQGPQQAPTTIL